MSPVKRLTALCLSLLLEDGQPPLVRGPGDSKTPLTPDYPAAGVADPIRRRARTRFPSARFFPCAG